MRRRKAAAAQLELAHQGAALVADSPADADNGLVHRSLAIAIRALNEAERSVDVTASSATVDAYDEVVEQDWDLRRYSANPVCLWNHGIGAYGNPEAALPIGYAKNVGVVDGSLRATLVFVTEAANPMAEKVWQGFVQKSIRAVSVGFDPKTITFEKVDDREFYRLSNNELFEISVCPMGANPDAVAKAKATSQLRALHAKSIAKALPIKVETPKGANQEKSAMDLEQRIKELEASAAKSIEAMAANTKAIELANAKVTEQTASLAASEKSLSDEKASAAKLSERAQAAEAAVIKAGVEALVGKKIEPAEAEEFIELATKQPELYAKMIAKRADLPTAVKTVVVPAEKGAAPALVNADGGNGEGLAALIDKAEDDDAA